MEAGLPGMRNHLKQSSVAQSLARISRAALLHEVSAAASREAGHSGRRTQDRVAARIPHVRERCVDSRPVDGFCHWGWLVLLVLPGQFQVASSTLEPWNSSFGDERPVTHP
jgi:hypothetical protein